MSAPRILAVLLLLLLACPAGRARSTADDPALPVATWQGLPVVAGRALVSFDPHTSAPRRQLVLAETGTRLIATLPDARALVESHEAIDVDTLLSRLRGLPEVAAVQPDALLSPVGTPSDPLWPQQWGPLSIGLPQAWALESGAPGTVIAVLDSGVDLDHPDLAPRLAWGFDAYAGDASPDDQVGHGSHCAGIAAAAADNGLGVAGAAGACRFAAYRCGNALFPTSTLLIAIDDAVARGAQVLSLSFGSSWSNPALRQALQAAAAAGCVLVAAAGNLGNAAPFYPAAWPEVLGVASSDPFGGRSAFSSFGPWVDLAAPGQSILSTWTGGGYAVQSGTSMACPLVAGTAALLYARLGGTRSPAHAARVTDALLGSAVDVGGWVAHGRLAPLAAISWLDAAGVPSVSAPASVGVGQELIVVLAGPGGNPAALLLSTSPGTLVVKGHALLATPLVLALGSLPDHGTLELSATVPSGAAGLLLHLQLAALASPGGLVASQPVVVAFTP